MPARAIRSIFPIIILLVLVVAAITYLTGVSEVEDGPLQASGTVEAIQLTIAPELGGRVVDVFVEEGNSVTAGQILVQLDDSLLKSQVNQVQAALAVAKANYDLVAAGMPEEQRLSAISAAKLELVAAQHALDALYEDAPTAAAQVQQAITVAEQAVEKAQRRLDNLVAVADRADIDAAHASLILARDQLENAKADFEPWENKPENNVTRATLQARVAAAQQAYDAAERRFNNLVGTADELDLAQAEADLELAQAQLVDIQRKAEDLQGGPDPDAIELAQARLANAHAQLTLAQADSPTPEQLVVARAQVDVAQANVDSVQLQIEKMRLVAPTDAVVLTRLVEPGEMALPNMPLLTLARLEQLTITVFVPEDRYGEIRLGQNAQVKVDSFPAETFTATVSYIADQAEFTPRNVQTAEGRRSTVFAIKLTVVNIEGRLKSGMPADVIFVEQP